ncbi:hypothetical protein B0A55_04586 [Friedmanniomyces simplex]|uniref:Uncharacterized protein n=1 Tax=Friedmanniomyces simplex TaxID=329884 RepID=A0A4U0XF37_9PEZI|nr:hypothetical protein B0A55_04586 [Friedmanniomyces simplex]
MDGYIALHTPKQGAEPEKMIGVDQNMISVVEKLVQEQVKDCLRDIKLRCGNIEEASMKQRVNEAKRDAADERVKDLLRQLKKAKASESGVVEVDFPEFEDDDEATQHVLKKLEGLLVWSHLKDMHDREVDQEVDDL